MILHDLNLNFVKYSLNAFMYEIQIAHIAIHAREIIVNRSPQSLTSQTRYLTKIVITATFFPIFFFLLICCTLLLCVYIYIYNCKTHSLGHRINSNKLLFIP